MKKILTYLRNYRLLLSFYLIKRSDNRSKNRMSIKVFKKACVNLASNATVRLEEDGYLVLGSAYGKGFRRPSLLSLGSGSVLTVHGIFSIFDNSKIYVRNHAHLELGSGYISSDATIVCTERITIGQGVYIADGIVIRDSDDHDILRDGYVRTMPVHIGNHVWIGHGVTILKGVTIGDGAVIGAGSIVTRDVPAHCLAAGNPAKVIRENVIWK